MTSSPWHSTHRILDHFDIWIYIWLNLGQLIHNFSNVLPQSGRIFMWKIVCGGRQTKMGDLGHPETTCVAVCGIVWREI